MHRDRLEDLALDLLRAKGVETLEEEIVQECQDLTCHDWVHEKGRDEVEFQLEVAHICEATDAELGIGGTQDGRYVERFFLIRDLVRKQFEFYARKRAEREMQ